MILSGSLHPRQESCSLLKYRSVERNTNLCFACLISFYRIWFTSRLLQLDKVILTVTGLGLSTVTFASIHSWLFLDHLHNLATENLDVFLRPRRDRKSWCSCSFLHYLLDNRRDVCWSNTALVLLYHSLQFFTVYDRTVGFEIRCFTINDQLFPEQSRPRCWAVRYYCDKGWSKKGSFPDFLLHFLRRKYSYFKFLTRLYNLEIKPCSKFQVKLFKNVAGNKERNDHSCHSYAPGAAWHWQTPGSTRACPTIPQLVVTQLHQIIKLPCLYQYHSLLLPNYIK